MNGGGNLPVGPGIWGFVAFFVLAVALWFLVRNMNNRLRRMAYRDRAEKLAADARVDGDGTTDDREASDVPGAEGDSRGAGPGRPADDAHPPGEDLRP